MGGDIERAEYFEVKAKKYENLKRENFENYKKRRRLKTGL